MNPIYEAASQVLRSLSPAVIDEIKAYPSPPAPVINIMNAVCLLFGREESYVIFMRVILLLLSYSIFSTLKCALVWNLELINILLSMQFLFIFPLDGKAPSS